MTIICLKNTHFLWTSALQERAYKYGSAIDFGSLTNPTLKANIQSRRVLSIQKKKNIMYTKLCVLLLAVGMSQAVPQLVMPDLNLMQFMMQTRDLQGNPARSLECFDYYIPILNGYAETYKKEFQQCLDVAAAARLEIDDTTVENRTVINNAANGACEALTECSKLEIATEFFQCYSNQVS